MRDFLDKFEQNVTSKNKIETECLNIKDTPLKINSLVGNLPFKRTYLWNGHDHACLHSCLKIALEAQRTGFVCIVDNENMIDNKIIEKFSLDKELILYHQVQEQTDMFDILTILLKENSINLIIINTILSLFPITLDMKDFTSKLNDFMVEFKKSNCCLFVVNPYNNLTYTFLNDYIDIIINSKFINNGQLSCNIIKNEYNFIYDNFIL